MPEPLSNDALVDERRPPVDAAASGRGCSGIFLFLIAVLVVAGFAAKFVTRRSMSAPTSKRRSRDSAVSPNSCEAATPRSSTPCPTEVLAYTASADEKVQGPLWEFASWVPFVGTERLGRARHRRRPRTSSSGTRFRRSSPSSARCSPTRSASKAAASTSSRSGSARRPPRGRRRRSPKAQEKVAGIDRDALLADRRRRRSGQVLEVIDQAAPLAHTATAVLPTALTMLGDQGPRTLPRAVPEQRGDPRHGRHRRRRGYLEG